MIDTISDVFRREHGRAVAVLTRQLGELSLAEEAVQDAFAAALEHWPVTGVPPAPAGWILTTARNRAIDRLRREKSRDQRHEAAMQLLDNDPPDHELEDDRLRLMFTCCHPALALEAQIALTLRMVGGLTTSEIAHAFLVPEPTLAQRISRAKAKIRAAGIPYRVPDAADLPARLRSVLSVIYLVFNEGYEASTGEELLRPELTAEALRLARLLHELMPDEAEVTGLLALMVFGEARRPARVDEHGAFVPLAEQDRGRWDRALLDEGQALVRECATRGRPGVYQLQAAISAVHAEAREAAQTDWRRILALYDRLMAVNPSPVVALNRAVALAEVDGPARALTLVDELALRDYRWFQAVRADLLRRLGRFEEAGRAYDSALGMTTNSRERDFLERRLASITPQ